MCFTNDGDYSPDIVEESVNVLTEPKRCRECHRQIESGKKMVTISMQEYEACQRCESGDCECGSCEGDGYECMCAEPNYGEGYETQMCLDCEKFRRAIGEAEIKAGCKVHESQPNLEEMKEAISDGGSEEAEKYWLQAMVMFPELTENGYLQWLWDDIFGEGE